MLLKPALFVLLMTASLPALAAGSTTCPEITGHALVNVRVFDGSIDKNFALIPEQHFPTDTKAGWNWWKLGYQGDPDGFFLQCNYDDRESLLVALPKKVKGCHEDIKTGSVAVVCK